MVVVFVRKRDPAANLHLLGRQGRRNYLRALQALVEVTQVTLQVGEALFVRGFTQRTLRAVLGLKAADMLFE
ncbi:hypothetical protein ALP29_200995 [Pseudomonas syringae pv. avii]|uniref:Uncharacterized protein n=1 Tax=Pseudomonas syringae pv. avii TaxID=663959 RepID=A0A3M5VXB7_PSESX|nr:hypothetical protein ALP29_200995 [Pseudomonas syringae pv. avii]